MSGLKKILSPSILSADFKKLGEELETIDKAGAEYVHVDVMDGLFVKSISFGMPVIKSARSATLEKIKECGVKAAITLNPPTPVSAIEPYLDKVDMVLVMSVNPGFGGQKFIPESLDKVKEIRTLLDAKGLDTDIEIDGGVNAGNLASILEAGANVIVAGSAIFSGDVADNVKKFKEIMGAW